MNWIFLLLTLLAFGIVALVAFKERLAAMFDTGLLEPSRTQSAAEYMNVTVSLPSKDVYFQFTCQFRVAYAPTGSNRSAYSEPSISSVESLLFTEGKELSVKLALPQKNQLKHELSEAFRTQRTLPSGDFLITAYCDEVEVDPKQLEAIERGYQEDLEADRVQRRVSYLGTVFKDPRIATMWWLAQHSDKVEELPEKAELLYRLDRRLNPDSNPSDLPISRDLDWFLETADDSERAAIGVALAGIYRRYGRDEFANEAELLIPNRTLPSRNGSEPDAPDNRIPGQPGESS